MTALVAELTPLKKVLIIGASGLTGQALLKELSVDQTNTEIHILLRQKLPTITADNIYQHIIDFNNIQIFEYLFQSDVVFCCLGTTLRKAKTKENFKAVDIDLVEKCAQLASGNSSKLIVVSALGANSNSWFFYNKCKGEMQNKVIEVCASNQTQVLFCQPSLLTGERQEKRTAESFSAQISQLLSFVWYGFMKRFKPISAQQLAKAMIVLAQRQTSDKVMFINNQTLHHLSKKH